LAIRIFVQTPHIVLMQNPSCSVLWSHTLGPATPPPFRESLHFEATREGADLSVGLLLSRGRAPFRERISWAESACRVRVDDTRRFWKLVQVAPFHATFVTPAVIPSQPLLPNGR